jgi:hypothetical protein
MKKGIQNMTQQNRMDSKGSRSVSRLLMQSTAIIGVMMTVLAAPARADWADQMGESSGVDRGAMLASAAVTGASQQQNMDTAALREAMANSLTSDLAGSLTAGGGVMPDAYRATGIVIPSIAASDDDDGMGDLG